jgi:diaminohydroxyphosphoribosylaminopyrimidine deaminase/5-amino-6-(5-phosphoribosylamino)uracil reductase
MVGAVVTRDDRLVAVGHHGQFGGPHAEVVALERSGERSRGGTLHITLEPCCHQGKTPPCTEAVIRAGVARVVAAMADPFPKVAGGGIARLREAGIAVEMAPEEFAVAARRLNAPYLKRLATGRPYVTAKWAMTLDGKLATATGSSQWISGPRSRALVHELRGRMDAILVGIGTVLADDPQLTARPRGPRVATRVVLDSTARLPVGSRLAQSARDVPVAVVVTQRAPAARCDVLRALGCEVIVGPADGSGRVAIEPLLDELGRRGATNLLVEGGSAVLGRFFEAGEVDEVDVSIAPAIEGGARSPGPVAGPGVETMAEALRLQRVEVSVIDGDVRLRGVVPRGAGWRSVPEPP